MKLDRNQLAKDILLQHINNMKSEGACKAIAKVAKRTGDTYVGHLARLSVNYADALIEELEK